MSTRVYRRECMPLPGPPVGRGGGVGGRPGEGGWVGGCVSGKRMPHATSFACSARLQPAPAGCPPAPSALTRREGAAAAQQVLQHCHGHRALDVAPAALGLAAGKAGKRVGTLEVHSEELRPTAATRDTHTALHLRWRAPMEHQGVSIPMPSTHDPSPSTSTALPPSPGTQRPGWHGSAGWPQTVASRRPRTGWGTRRQRSRSAAQPTAAAQPGAPAGARQKETGFKQSGGAARCAVGKVQLPCHKAGSEAGQVTRRTSSSCSTPAPASTMRGAV